MLRRLRDPDTLQPLAFSALKEIDPASPLRRVRQAILQQARAVEPSAVVPPHPRPRHHVKRAQGLSNVEHVVCVSSGKGGVGKSTVATNLAVRFAQLGARTGLFDADVHGPSLPTMMVPRNGGSWKVTKSNGMVSPVLLHGVTCMSFGFVGPGTGGRGQRMDGVDASVRGPSAAMMRGPMASKTVEELCATTDWGELDVLVVDLPPGTGDVHLALCQRLQFNGAVIVTTPQELSFVDVARGIDMLEALKVPVFAAVENLSWFACRHGERHFPFGKGHLDRLRDAYGIPHVVALPMLADASHAGDAGVPLVVTHHDGEAAETYTALCQAVSHEMVRKAELGALLRPSVSYDAERKLIVARFFDADGAVELTLPPLELRRRLGVVDKMLKVGALPADLAPMAIAPKGNYAVTIQWSSGGDAHSIYSFDAIRKAAVDYAKER